MDPNNGSVPNFNVPPPSSPGASGGIDPNAPVQNPAQPFPGAGVPPQAPPLTAPPAGAVQIQPQPILPTQPVAPPPAIAVPIEDETAAGDSDLIEKEWVLKAKAIVAQTRDDPYNQNKQMNKVKADYLKKRYNKDIKVNDE